jgi:hypothetical protein
LCIEFYAQPRKAPTTAGGGILNHGGAWRADTCGAGSRRTSPLLLRGRIRERRIVRVMQAG